MVGISSISYAVSAASRSSTAPIMLSHAQQLVAAALGYKSLAAFQASPLEASTLDEAAHFILDGALLVERIQNLSLPNPLPEVAMFIKAAFNNQLPSARLHETVGDLYCYVTELVDDRVLNDGAVEGEIASTNNDGVDEVYIPVDNLDLDELPQPGHLLEQELEGHVAMTVDTERPYSGHKIKVRATVTFERTGKVSIKEPVCEVIDAQIAGYWDDDGHTLAKVSLAQALADETGLTVEEAEELLDVDAVPNASDDGLVYGYVLDFSDHASPATAAKLRAKYGSTWVEVPSWFFDRIDS